MTAWQNQPPQSRRQLRLNERAGAHDGDAVDNRQQDSQVGVAESVEPSTIQHPAVQQSGVEPPRDAFARPGWDAPARRDAVASESPASAASQPRSRAEAAIASGRRSLHSFPHAAPAEPRGNEPRSADLHDTDSRNADSHEAGSHNAEPLDYFTQGRSQVPVYGGPSFGVNAVTPPPADTDEAGQPGATAGSYRIRDFSPESRRSAFSSTAEPAPPSASTGGQLDYYTQQGNGKQAANEQSPADVRAAHIHAADIRTADTHTADTVAADAPATDHEAHGPRIEHTMTRRELRAMRESSTVGPAVPAPLIVPAQPTVESSVPSAPHAWSIGQVEQSVPEHESSKLENSELGSSGFDDPGFDDSGFDDSGQAAPPESSARAADRFPLDLSAAQSETPAPLQDPIPLRPPLAPAPKSSRELSDAMAEFDALMARGSDAVPLPEVRADDGSPAVPAPRARLFPVEVTAAEVDATRADATWARDVARHDSEPDSGGVEVFDTLLGGEQKAESDEDADHRYVAPAGHWSRQATSDESQVGDGITLSRDIGTTGGAVTASHLVISSVPTANDLLKPFSPTGEIMITGTIDLPRSLGTTGAHPARYDHSDVDTLLEASDREDSNVDSAPVRAIRAVSTHTSSRGLIGSGKPPRSSKLPMILAVSTAAVAAVVVVLFVAGLVLHVF